MMVITGRRTSGVGCHVILAPIPPSVPIWSAFGIGPLSPTVTMHPPPPSLQSNSMSQTLPSTTSMQESASLSVANTPFNKKHLADVIIRASDGVDFYVLKGVLMLASPFFESMFSLAQPLPEHSTPSFERIPVAEASDILDPLLRLCYPVDDPAMESLPLTEKVLEAAIKYEMIEATKILKTALRGFVKHQPLPVFAAACRLRLEDEATLAAAEWKTRCARYRDEEREFTSTLSGASYVPEMGDIPAGAYHRLLQYLKSDTPITLISPPPRRDDVPHSELASYATPLNYDVTLRSTDNHLFPVQSAVLRAAGAGAMLDGAPAGKVREAEPENRPTIDVSLCGTHVRSLISFSYPLLSLPLARSLPHVMSVLEAAINYDMTEIVNVGKRLMMSLVDSDPLTVYFYACRRRWTEEMRLAAQCAVAQSLVGREYVWEMEDSTAVDYHRLLELQHRFLNIVRDAVHSSTSLGQSAQWRSLSTERHQATPVSVSVTLLEEVLDQAQMMVKNYDSSSSYCQFCNRGRRGSCHCAASEYFGRSTLTVGSILVRSETLHLDLKKQLEQLGDSEASIISGLSI